MTKIIVHFLFILVIPFALLMVAFGEDAKQIDLPDHPELGIKVFKEKNCIQCHSIWDEGGAIGPDLTKVVKGKSFYQIIGQFWNHFPRMISEMNAQGIAGNEMSASDVKYLVAYLYYLNYYDQTGDFDKGEILFKTKSCVECHSLGGGGEKLGPPLDKFGWMVSPVYLGTQMWNHRPEMKAFFEEKNLELPEFEKQDLADILAYIRGMSIDETENRQYLEPGHPNAGRKIFETKKCNTCHSVFGSGGDKAPDLGESSLSLGITELTGTVWNHLGEIEELYSELKLELPQFEPQEMADLLTYLYFIGFYDEKGDCEQGAKLFEEKGCISCHSVDGVGDKSGNLGPDLVTSEVEFGSFEFAARMWNHATEMGEMLEDEIVAWPTFKDDEMRDLIFYLKSKMKQK